MDDDATQSNARPAPDRQASPHARLVVVFPAPLARAVPLGATPTRLGRAAASGAGAVELPHRTISREHAELSWDARRGAHVLRDLGSHNGSHVEGRRADVETLEAGAVVRLGDVVCVYEPAPHEDEPAPTDALPGRAASLRELRRGLARAAAGSAPVLLLGETGTGKEHVARELHRLSGRAGPFVAVNCAALGKDVFESQLFGHARGAFTGATEARPGLFRSAEGGTLFLDEVGDLAPEHQPKLLRALELGEILPLGAARPLRVDARVVAATHTLPEAFRADLLARLAVRLALPPVRARRVDLLDWLARFGAPVDALSADVAEAVLLHPHPENLRGLARLARTLAEHPAATAKELFPEGGATPTQAKLAPPTREAFVEAYRACGGSVRALARRFERDRRQIYRWIEAYGLERQRSP